MDKSLLINTLLRPIVLKYWATAQQWCIIYIIVMYHRVLIATYIYNMATKAKSPEIKQSIPAFWLLIGRSLGIVNFSKTHI